MGLGPIFKSHNVFQWMLKVPLSLMLILMLMLLLMLSWRIPVADVHSKILDAPPPPGGPNSFISCGFWEFLAKSYVGAPPHPRGVGAPTSGKTWIRHFILLRSIHTMHFFCIICVKCKEWVLYPFSAFDATSP